MAYGGAQAHHGVTPDLTTMSKAIGGGLPLAAVGGRAEIMDLLDPELHGGKAPVAAPRRRSAATSAALAAGIACLEQLTPEVHARVQAIGDRARSGIDELGRRYDIPLHATGLGHLFGMHWAPERVVDYRTRMQDDREKVATSALALINEGFYQMSLGYFLLSAEVGEAEIDGFLAALERALHTLGYATRAAARSRGGWPSSPAAARGIGEAICVRLARDGARVAVLDVAREAAELTATLVGGVGRPGRRSGRGARRRRARRASRRQLGPVDIWVNNAGIAAVANAERVRPRASSSTTRPRQARS